jgi:hypothetical protein
LWCGVAKVMSLLSRAEEYLKQAEDQANLLGGGEVGVSPGPSPGNSPFPFSHQTPTRGGFNSRLPRLSAADIPSRY